MMPNYYLTRWQSYLNNEQGYQYLFENNLSSIINEKIINYAKK